MSTQKTKDNPVIYDEASKRIDIFCIIDRNAVLHVQSILAAIAALKGRVLELENRDDNLDLTVVVNTRGGEALQGLAIYDLLRVSGLNVKTVILGEVASSGLAVIMAGRERWMYRHAILHFHQTAMEFGEPKKILERHETDIERAQIEEVDRLYNEITLANSNLTLEQLESLERREAYVTAPEALELGLIHKIID